MAQTKIREGQTDIAIRDFTDSEVKEQINTTTYDTFGLLIKVDDDNIIYFIRQGTSHVGDKGKIVGQKYTLSTRTWGTRYDVYEDANGDYDSRNVSGGIIGSNIYLFFLRYNLNTTTIIDIGYIKSTDLTGTSWGNYTSVATGLTDPNTYGSIVETSVSGKYLIPVRGTDGADSAIILLETTDSGDNWAVGDTIYTGAVTYTETCITHIGSGKMIALIRNNAGSYVNQSMSADNGETWSAPALTNLGASTGEKIPWIIYNSYSNKVISIYVDRTDYLVKMMYMLVLLRGIHLSELTILVQKQVILLLFQLLVRDFSMYIQLKFQLLM